MQKLLLGFAVFAAVVIFTVSRGGNVDVSAESKGISYAESVAASAPTPSAPVASEQAPQIAQH
jgi:hypothetical protein